MGLSTPNQAETSYFSETLLKVLLGHSSRFRAQGHPFQDPQNTIMRALSQQAHFSLAMRIAGPSSIPTIQALLQQSAREIAFGNSSQGTLITEMGFQADLCSLDLFWHGLSYCHRPWHPPSERQAARVRQEPDNRGY